MKKYLVAACPYCNKKFDYWFIFNIKEYDKIQCDHCKKILRVKLTKRIYNMARIIEFAAFIIAIIACIILKGFWVILSACLIGALFIFFHFQVPFEIKLTKQIKKSASFTDINGMAMNDRQRINFIEPIDDQ